MYKVWILGVGESTYATNGVDFDTVDEATSWANDLLCRWFGADKFAILPKADEFAGFLSKDTVNDNALVTG